MNKSLKKDFSPPLSTHYSNYCICNISRISQVFHRAGHIYSQHLFKSFKHYRVGCFIITSLPVCSVGHCVSWYKASGHVAAMSWSSFHLWTNEISLHVSTFSDAEDWFCECPPLYTGRLCQFNACERNPCSHGATCIPKSQLEAVCLCPYGRQGLLCDECECYSATQINAV